MKDVQIVCCQLYGGGGGGGGGGVKCPGGQIQVGKFSCQNSHGQYHTCESTSAQRKSIQPLTINTLASFPGSTRAGGSLGMRLINIPLLTPSRHRES